MKAGNTRLSRGALGFAQVRLKLGGAELARRLGASETAVRAWASGARKPSGAARAHIEDVLDIPVGDWADVPPKPRAPRRGAPRGPSPSLDELRPLVERIDAATARLEAEGAENVPGGTIRRLLDLRQSICTRSRQWRDALLRWGA